MLIDLKAIVPSLPLQVLHCRADAVAKLEYSVVTLRHPSKGGSVGTSSDDGIRRDPSRLRVVGLKLALCELVS